MHHHLSTAELLFISLFSISAHCEGWSFNEARSDPGQFSLGFVGGIVAHELGHYAVATSKGYKASHDGLSIVYPGANFTSLADHLQVSSAGFQAQWLMTELALRDNNFREREGALGNISAGIVMAHLSITAAYLVYLKDHQQGDIVGMTDATGLSNNQIALALAIPGALDAWRLFGNDVPKWVPGLSLMGKGIGMAWIWAY